MLRLRLFHSAEGARIAYREGGTGPPLVLWHSRGLNHREFVPAARELQDRARWCSRSAAARRFGGGARLPYDLDWVARLVAEFTHDVGGPRPGSAAAVLGRSS